jgi:hypothetical protein
MSDKRSGSIAVTYANDKLTDGVGAQLQRIYGVYAISRFLGLTYFHSPLIHVGYQGLRALENGSLSPDPNFDDPFNALFTIPSDVELPERYDVVEIDNATIDGLRRHAESASRPTLARLTLPHSITDQCPDSYEVCKAISPFSHLRNDGVLKIAVHVRRGEIFANNPTRLLPNSYYLNVAKNIVGILERQGFDYQIELHTEVSTREIVVHPGHPLLHNEISKPVIINASLNQIEDFDVLPHLVKRINEPTIDCLCRIATADIIVISRSSFSYVAAILSNPKAIVIFHPFWHAAMSSWIRADEDGSFDELPFLAKLRNLRE